MKHIFTFFLLLLILISPTFFIAQPLYLKKINPPVSDNMMHSHFVLPQPDNSILDFGVLSSKGIISKIDSTGSIKWTRSYLFDSNPNFKSIFIDATNSYDSSYATVGIAAKNSPYTDAYCMKLKANGDTLWCRKLTNNNLVSIIPYSINQTLDSGFVICGRTTSTSVKAFVAKLTKTGTLTWFKNISPSNFFSIAYTIKQTADSGYIFNGRTGSGLDAYSSITKLDKNGNFSWQKMYNHPPTLGNGEDYTGLDVIVEADGYLCLNTLYYNSSLMKTDLSGNILWTKRYNTPFNFSSIYQRPASLKKIAGNKRLVTFKDEDSEGWSFVCDSLGAFQWGCETFITGIDMAQLKNKNFIMVGNPSNIIFKTSSPLYVAYGQLGVIVTDSLGTGNTSCYQPYNISATLPVMGTGTLTSTLTNAGTLSSIQPTISIINLTDSIGCLIMPVGIEENEYASTYIYPNPTEGKLTIQSEALKGKSVTFKLYDVTGKTLLIQEIKFEENEESIDLTKFDPSVYFYSIFSNGNRLKNGKFIIAK